MKCGMDELEKRERYKNNIRKRIQEFVMRDKKIIGLYSVKIKKKKR